MVKSSPGYSAFEGRDDLRKFGSNALLLFLAQLRIGFDDVDVFAANALTDHNNDKKADLVAVVNDGAKVVVAQGYFSDVERLHAPEKKAADLNTAVSWLISGPLESVPAILRGAAEEVRDALSAGSVLEFEIWYVHNRGESANVQRELDQAARTADASIQRAYPDSAVDVVAIEYGLSGLEAVYAKTLAPILVDGKFEFSIPGGFEIQEQGWSAFSTVLEAPALRELWKAHGTDLMSPNVRDYLGMARKQGNINFGIKKTAKDQPENFAIFNNGITVLVNRYSHDELTNTLHVNGVGIINGGQTTGAIGELNDAESGRLPEARVMTRFVKCTEPDVLEQIVRFNNTQNKVEATDFRSNDQVQERLRVEFEAIPDAEYKGGRRGGSSDAILRSRGLLSDSSVAQSLAAFHGRPNLAYNDTRTIWDNDAVYASVFRDSLSARHIVLVVSLLRAIDAAKQSIMAIEEHERTEAQARHADFLRARGSNMIFLAALGGCIESILGRPVASRVQLVFKDNLSPADAQAAWRPIVDVLMSFSKNLISATNQGLKSQDKVAEAIQSFSAMVEATRDANSVPFESLSQLIISLPGDGDRN